MLSHFSNVQLFATPWTVTCQAPLFKGFSRQDYWSGLPFPPPGDLPDPEIKPELCVSSALQAFFTTEPPGKPHIPLYHGVNIAIASIIFGCEDYKVFTS